MLEALEPHITEILISIFGSLGTLLAAWLSKKVGIRLDHNKIETLIHNALDTALPIGFNIIRKAVESDIDDDGLENVKKLMHSGAADMVLDALKDVKVPKELSHLTDIHRIDRLIDARVAEKKLVAS